MALDHRSEKIQNAFRRFYRAKSYDPAEAQRIQAMVTADVLRMLLRGALTGVVVVVVVVLVVVFAGK